MFIKLHNIKNHRMNSLFLFFCILFFIGYFFVIDPVRAIDGSGTNSVSPTTANAGSTGNTLTFTYTASEVMDSGEMTITVPSSWSAPQSVIGTAGYTTVSSVGAIIANVEDNLNSTTNWVAQSGACNSGFVADTVLFHEGSASLACRNASATNNTKFYRNLSVVEDWSAYTNVGFWIRTSVNLNSGQLKFQYDDTASLATAIGNINVPAITANTWTYVNLPLSGGRSSIISLGFQIAGASAQTNNINIDDILLGPGSLTFPGSGDIRLRLLQASSGQTMTVVYGAGGGTSGATAPASGEISTFTTKTRISDIGTLTTITSSPTVTVNNPSPVVSNISPESKIGGSAEFTLTVNGANFTPSSVVKFAGSNRTTVFVNSGQLTATIPATDIVADGTFSITVFNTTPGGGTSNAVTFTVNATPPPPDTTPPAAITNLVLTSLTASTMTLTWTAPGDDGSVGAATSYDIRYSTSIINESNWASATQVVDEPHPLVASTSQTMTVSGLSGGVEYFFAMKTSDGVPNTSGISNVPSLVVLSSVAPGPIGGGGQFFGSINVIKVVINDHGGTKKINDFSLYVNSVSVISGETNMYPARNVEYLVTESTDSKYIQTFSGDCDVNGKMTLIAGDNKICIVTNDDIGASVILPPLVPPLIAVVKVPSPLALPAGPGLVTYIYTTRNIGTVPMTDVTMVGDTCRPIVFVSGDTNGDLKLDVNETWTYACSTTLTETHTNTVTATGWSKGISAVDVASATVVVGAPIVPPLIHVTKTPSKFVLPDGGGMITYIARVTNPGKMPLNDIQITDNKCSPMKYFSGDINGDSKLDINETWRYTCQASLFQTTINTAVASGQANGLTARDFVIATVVVSAPVFTRIEISSSLEQLIQNPLIHLEYGTVGDDVRILQQFLISQNKGSYARALGVHGTTLNFGPLTRSALIEWQKAVGITLNLGVFGLETRNFIIANYNLPIVIPVASVPLEPVPSDPIFVGQVQSIVVDLKFGSVGDDVRILQQFLISQNKGPYAIALGVHGTTLNFGPLTQSALAEWQKAVGIDPPLGNFGPITRAYLSANY